MLVFANFAPEKCPFFVHNVFRKRFKRVWIHTFRWILSQLWANKKKVLTMQQCCCLRKIPSILIFDLPCEFADSLCRINAANLFYVGLVNYLYGSDNRLIFGFNGSVVINDRSVFTNLVHNFNSFCYMSKCSIVSIKKWRILMHDEELA